MLTYNLAIDSAVERPSAAKHPSFARFRSGLQQAQTQLHGGKHLPEGLKSRDLAQLQVLKDLSSELPFEVFLGLLEKEEMGGVEYDGGYDRYDRWGHDETDEENEDDYLELNEIFDTKYRVKTLHDLQGRKVMNGLSLSEDDILQEDAFEGLDHEDYE
ncbi:hypothetical protein B0H66DRAFT_608929 [Apodospora peruviana]|uniref:Uncharacterized protein n=1 Tax=Apodospora peruviana TaxID=516989 RepID=A0AAE0HSE3_9PEZI|nr:hypothetical protein B0H66DRAFT_608929 [Apodospora peruviana]